MPKRITIGPLVFKVKTGKTAHHAAERDSGVTVDGWSKLSDEVILVAPTNSRGYAQVVLLHEVVHMCLGVAGADKFEETVEEKFVSGLASTLLDTFRNNPDLVDYLLTAVDA